MSRAETTAMLSKLVEKRLKNQTAFWASEVNFDRNTPDERRVDYVGFKPWNINGEPVPASVEKGCFEFYEVKSCMADFTSGNGLTFYGDSNFLVCTKELCGETVGAYYVTCPYCGYRMVSAQQAVMDGLAW